MVNPVDFIHKLRYEDIPEEVREAARICLMDATGSMLGGMRDRGVQKLAGAIADRHPGTSRIAGSRLTTTRAWAAFINTHSCSYFDIDDGHRKAQGHPGGIIVPISLMLAAEAGAGGRELLTAVVAGYEIAVRSALLVREAGGPRKGSGGWSIFGGVAAAARLLGFSREQIQDSLGLAEYYAPQAPQDNSLASPSSMKEGMAWAAHATISITELAGIGFDGMVPSLVGSPYCTDLGTNWEIGSTYYKMYACCRFSHPVLDGLSSLLEKGLRVEEIESVTVTSFAKAMLLNHLTPVNPVAAMYSIPFIIGCFLVNGRIGVEDMGEDSLNNPAILAMARKIRLVEDLELTRQFPLQCLARISVRLKDGNTIDSEVLSARGDPDNPYTREELEEKFRHLTIGIGRTASERLIGEISALENGSPEKLWQDMVL